MLSQQLDLLDGLINISNQCMGQLHLVGEASNAVATFRGQHHGFSSFSGMAREVAVLQMLRLIILFMLQDSQSFSCSISIPPTNVHLSAEALITWWIWQI
jgi:hypothetical protein